jgi:hypothetical protein
MIVTGVRGYELLKLNFMFQYDVVKKDKEKRIKSTIFYKNIPYLSIDKKHSLFKIKFEANKTFKFTLFKGTIEICKTDNFNSILKEIDKLIKNEKKIKL